MRHVHRRGRHRAGAAFFVVCSLALTIVCALVLGSAPPEIDAAPVPEAAATPEAEPPAPLVLTRAEILESPAKLIGVHSPNLPFSPSEYRDYLAAAGRAPNVIESFAKWDEPFRADAADASYALGAIPLISWESWVKGGDRSDPAFAVERIASGEYDDYIRTFATAVAEYGKPVIIRFDHEMNGNWYPWGDRVNGNTGAGYAEMWRRVHGMFGQAGAANVVWLWSPNIVRAVSNANHPLDSFYPGDEFVDYIGMTGYSVGEPTAADVFQPTVDILRTFTQKPILIAEVGASTFRAKPEFIDSLFAYVRDGPGVVGFIWFQTTTASGASGDWRFDDTPESVAAYAAGLAAADLLPVLE